MKQYSQTDEIKPLSILVVDDEESITNIIQQKIKREFPTLSVYTASSGEKALSIFSERKIDVLLTDINMPDMSGIELMQFVNEKYKNPPIPVIVITVRKDLSAAIESVKLAYDYLLKPFRDPDLYVSLQRALDKRRKDQSILDFQKNLVETCEQLHWAMKEIKEKEKQLIQTSKLAALGQLAAGMSHEINNPLSAISTRVQFMKIKYKEINEKLYDSLSRDFDFILSGANRIIKIITHVNEFSRKGSDDEKKNVLVKMIYNNALDVLEHKIRLQSVEFSFHSDDNVMIFADPIQIEQVFINLFSNSIDAHAKKIDVHVSSGDNITIIVRDNGDGIENKHIQNIFDPFFTTKEVGKGLGMGLSVVYGIMQNHHGEIRVESIPKQGTTFYISFPKI